MKLTLATIVIVTAIATLTWLGLEAVGANVFGPDCSSYEQIGKVCY